MKEPEFKSKAVWLPKEKGLSQESQETASMINGGSKESEGDSARPKDSRDPSTEVSLDQMS